jgi:hypothetical protein
LQAELLAENDVNVLQGISGPGGVVIMMYRNMMVHGLSAT